MTEPLKHVLRPTPPWRDAEPLTECGLDEWKAAVTRAEFVADARRLGQQRTALLYCMTCYHTAQRHSNFRTRDVADDPPLIEVLNRDLHGKNRQLLDRELEAIALVVAAHGDEFRDVLAGLDAAPSLADARNARRARQHFGG